MASSQHLSSDGQESPMTLTDMTLTTAQTAVKSTKHEGESPALPLVSQTLSTVTQQTPTSNTSSSSQTPSSTGTNTLAKVQSSAALSSLQPSVNPFNSLSRSSLAAQTLSPCHGSSLFSTKFAQLAAIAAGQKSRMAGNSVMQAPCFFHKRFDDAINIERVLEEVSEGDGYSHSRLMQTAISVREISKQLQRRAIKRAVKSVMIVTKARDNSLVTLTRDLAIWLLTTPRYGFDVGINVYVDSKLKTSKRFGAQSIEALDPRFSTMLNYWNPDMCWTRPDKFDLVLTLGGDGTVLYTAAVLFQRVAPPVLAFSLGSLGFLTNFDFNNYRSTLNNIMGDEGMRVNLRMRFTCTIFRANRMLPKARAKANVIDTNDMIEGEKFEVLNELVIDRGPSPYVSNLELYGDDKLLTIVQADGCIFSTPTGSTAYSLSAGGPLTHPSIPGLVLTPICPHTLSFRPMVLHDSLCLKVCVPRKSRSTAWASFDGKHRVELQKGDLIQVEAGRYPFPTVVGPSGTGGEWFESVQRALRWNTRGATQKSFSKNSSKPKMGLSGNNADLAVSGARLAAMDLQEDENEDDGEDDEDETSTPAGEDGWDIDFDEAEVPPSDSGVGLSETSQSSMLPSPMISARSSIAG